MLFSVFERKIEELFDKVTLLDIFGSNQEIMKSLEEQEWGLLHAHCMLWIVERPDVQELEKIISPQFQIRNKIFRPVANYHKCVDFVYFGVNHYQNSQK